MTRRVVVTGIGAVSPNGIGLEAFWAATCSGKSGVLRITAFDPADLPVQIAGEISDFDPLRHISAKDADNVSRTVPLAIAAAREAVEDAGLEPDRMALEVRRRIGVLLGSGGGARSLSNASSRFTFPVACASAVSTPSPLPPSARWRARSPYTSAFAPSAT